MAELLKPCPFCEGPPVPIVQNDTANRGAAPLQDNYGPKGLYARAFVFCHECGAEGPAVEDTLWERSDYFALEAVAVRLWQDRDARHRGMYDAGVAQGLERYPREAANG